VCVCVCVCVCERERERVCVYVCMHMMCVVKKRGRKEHENHQCTEQKRGEKSSKYTR